MKGLPANFHLSPTLFSFLEPSRLAPGRSSAGSNGKDNHDEAPFAKPPPIFTRDFLQNEQRKAPRRPSAIAFHGAARVARDAVDHATANRILFAIRPRQTA